MKIIKVVVNKLPVSVSECKAVKDMSMLPGVNSGLHRVFCKLDIRRTESQLMSTKELTTRRCPNCPLVEEVQE